MVKKEIEGKVGPIGGRMSSEYTERYEFIKEAILAAEEVLRGNSCTPERISKIVTGLKVLEDSTQSEITESIKKALKGALRTCSERGECRLPIDED